jgi:carboxymethylenebutenolidase
MPETMLDAADGSGRFGCLVERPKATPAGAVVLIQEIFGVNANMRALAAYVADMGFLALVPDLFWRQQPGVQLDPDAGQAQWEQAFAFMKGFDQRRASPTSRPRSPPLAAWRARTARSGPWRFCLADAWPSRPRSPPTPSATSPITASAWRAWSARRRISTRPSPAHRRVRQVVPAEAREAIVSRLAGNPRAVIHVYPGVDHAFARLGGHSWDARAATIANGRSAEFLVAHLG